MVVLLLNLLSLFLSIGAFVSDNFLASTLVVSENFEFIAFLKVVNNESIRRRHVLLLVVGLGEEQVKLRRIRFQVKHLSFVGARCARL